jgi:hypothetical protein
MRRRQRDRDASGRGRPLGARGRPLRPPRHDGAARVSRRRRQRRRGGDARRRGPRPRARAGPTDAACSSSPSTARSRPSTRRGPWARSSSCARPTVPLDRIDMMIALELLGHRIGPEGLPDAVAGRCSRWAPSAARGPRARRRPRRGRAGHHRATRRRGGDSAPVRPPRVLGGGRALHAADGHAPEHVPHPQRHPRPPRLGAHRRRLALARAFVRDQCARPEARVRFLRRRARRPLHPRHRPSRSRCASR